jgi:hypothetical protein
VDPRGHDPMVLRGTDRTRRAGAAPGRWSGSIASP